MNTQAVNIVLIFFGKNKNITVKLDLCVSHSLKQKLSMRRARRRVSSGCNSDYFLSLID